MIGRPVDVAVGPDGALYVSDDYTGQIYRVAHGEEAKAPVVPQRAPAPTSDPLAALDEADRASARATGTKLWDEAGCASCHGPARDEGHRPLSNLASRYDIESLARFLAAPQPPMPLYPLDEDQRRELAIFLLMTRG